MATDKQEVQLSFKVSVGEAVTGLDNLAKAMETLAATAGNLSAAFEKLGLAQNQISASAKRLLREQLQTTRETQRAEQEALRTKRARTDAAIADNNRLEAVERTKQVRSTARARVVEANARKEIAAGRVKTAQARADGQMYVAIGKEADSSDNARAISADKVTKSTIEATKAQTNLQNTIARGNNLKTVNVNSPRLPQNVAADVERLRLLGEQNVANKDAMNAATRAQKVLTSTTLEGVKAQQDYDRTIRRAANSVLYRDLMAADTAERKATKATQELTGSMKQAAPVARVLIDEIGALGLFGERAAARLYYLRDAVKSISKAAEESKGALVAMAVGGVAVAGAAAVAAALGGILSVGMAAEKSWTSIDVSLKNTNSSLAAHKTAIDQVVNTYAKLGFKVQDTLGAIQQGLGSRLTLKQTVDVMQVAADLAARQGKTLQQGVETILSVHGPRDLGRALGIRGLPGFKKISESSPFSQQAAQAIEQLLRDPRYGNRFSFGGQAAAQAQTLQGAINRLTAALTVLGDILYQRIKGPLTGFVNGLANAVLGINSLILAAQPVFNIFTNGFIANFAKVAISMTVLYAIWRKLSSILRGDAKKGMAENEEAGKRNTTQVDKLQAALKQLKEMSPVDVVANFIDHASAPKDALIANILRLQAIAKVPTVVSAVWEQKGTPPHEPGSAAAVESITLNPSGDAGAMAADIAVAKDLEKVHTRAVSATLALNAPVATKINAFERAISTAEEFAAASRKGSIVQAGITDSVAFSAPTVAQIANFKNAVTTAQTFAAQATAGTVRSVNISDGIKVAGVVNAHGLASVSLGASSVTWDGSLASKASAALTGALGTVTTTTPIAVNAPIALNATSVAVTPVTMAEIQTRLNAATGTGIGRLRRSGKNQLRPKSDVPLRVKAPLTVEPGVVTLDPVSWKNAMIAAQAELRNTRSFFSQIGYKNAIYAPVSVPVALEPAVTVSHDAHGKKITRASIDLGSLRTYFKGLTEPIALSTPVHIMAPLEVFPGQTTLSPFAKPVDVPGTVQVASAIQLVPSTHRVHGVQQSDIDLGGLRSYFSNLAEPLGLLKPVRIGAPVEIVPSQVTLIQNAPSTPAKAGKTASGRDLGLFFKQLNNQLSTDLQRHPLQAHVPVQVDWSETAAQIGSTRNFYQALLGAVGAPGQAMLQAHVPVEVNWVETADELAKTRAFYDALLAEPSAIPAPTKAAKKTAATNAAVAASSLLTGLNATVGIAAPATQAIMSGMWGKVQPVMQRQLRAAGEVLNLSISVGLASAVVAAGSDPTLAANWTALWANMPIKLKFGPISVGDAPKIEPTIDQNKVKKQIDKSIAQYNASPGSRIKIAYNAGEIDNLLGGDNSKLSKLLKKGIQLKDTSGKIVDTVHFDNGNYTKDQQNPNLKDLAGNLVTSFWPYVRDILVFTAVQQTASSGLNWLFGKLGNFFKWWRGGGKGKGPNGEDLNGTGDGSWKNFTKGKTSAELQQLQGILGIGGSSASAIIAGAFGIPQSALDAFTKKFGPQGAATPDGTTVSSTQAHDLAWSLTNGLKAIDWGGLLKKVGIGLLIVGGIAAAVAAVTVAIPAAIAAGVGGTALALVAGVAALFVAAFTGALKIAPAIIGGNTATMLANVIIDLLNLAIQKIPGLSSVFKGFAKVQPAPPAHTHTPGTPYKAGEIDYFAHQPQDGKNFYWLALGGGYYYYTPGKRPSSGKSPSRGKPPRFSTGHKGFGPSGSLPSLSYDAVAASISGQSLRPALPSTEGTKATGATYHFNGPVTVQANNPREFALQMAAMARGLQLS